MTTIDGALQSGRYSQSRCAWRSRVSDPNVSSITPQDPLQASGNPTSAQPFLGWTGEIQSRIGKGSVCLDSTVSSVSVSLTRQIGGEDGMERGEIHPGIQLRFTVEAGSHVSISAIYLSLIHI